MRERERERDQEKEQEKDYIIRTKEREWKERTRY